MFTPDLLSLLRCPADHASLVLSGEVLECTKCKERYPLRDGYVEILPRETFEHTTQYNEESGQNILDYREIGPPLLSAKIKNDMLNDFLHPGASDTVLDLGCGNGKFAYWNRGRVRQILALDLAPWFADKARLELPLIRGDIRRLPFEDASFDKVYSIDVLEHLTASDIGRVLDEAGRTLKSHGRLFIFSNTREPPTLAWAMRPQKALTNWLKSRGLVDFHRDEWRKSDHVKAIATFEQLESTFASHGFRVKQVAFWNGFFQGWVENVLLKVGEGLVSKREPGGDEMERQVSARHKVRSELATSRRGRFYLPLYFLTALMSLDLKWFGRLRAGPYFVLAERTS